MTVFPVFIWGALAVVIMVTAAIVADRRRQAMRLSELQGDWGSAIERECDMTAIAAYCRACAATDPQRTMDDRTWDDLNMDDVFCLLDRTQSALGQQLLYTRLRSTPQGGHLAAFEALVTRLSDDATARERAQLALGKLRSRAAYDLYLLTLQGSLETARWQIVFPIAGVCMLGMAVLVPFWPAALMLLMVGAIGSLVARASVAQALRVVAGAFRQVAPLVAAAGVLRSLDVLPEGPFLSALHVDTPRLSRLRRIASWAGRDPTAAAGGDLSALLFEYLNMVFWLDANALFFGARELHRRGPELLRVIAAVGEVDAAISIASYRAGTPGWTRPVFVPVGPATLCDVRHPLLASPVANSIVLTPPHGVIITGSNMSGKTTFLRTVGVTAILAQTVNTCLATSYSAPVFSVRSSIGRTDDLTSGKSYYLMEVESVLSLVRAAQDGQPHLMLFDELFRGTNAVERIAGGEAVLRVLLAPAADGRPSPHVVIVATHDQELVDLLDGTYAPYHFSDAITAGGLVFDYTLKAGPATTRNAIALLKERGAPPELVAHALARAEALDRTRSRSAIASRSQ